MQAQILENERAEGEAKQVVAKMETDLKEQQRDQQGRLTEQQRTISRLETILQQEQDSVTVLQTKLESVLQTKLESGEKQLQELQAKEVTSYKSRDGYYLLWWLISILVLLLAFLMLASVSGRPCCTFRKGNIFL